MTPGTSASIDTVASLRSCSAPVPASVQVYGFDVQGHASMGDSGGTIIVDAAGCRWYRLPASYVTFNQFGAFGAGGTVDETLWERGA